MKLSIVILNFNTKDVLINCLKSIVNNTSDLKYEIIVVDNGSSDGSVEAVKNLKIKSLKVVENNQNLGFAKGNNKAKDVVQGEFVLILNSDTLVHKGTLKDVIYFIESRDDVGAIGCKTVLPSVELDRDARRSFPTPWVAFCHYSGLDRVFPKSELFARYWYGFRSPKETHEVDVLQGAFTLVRKSVMDDVGWYDEDYFLNGEDIDLCWKIKEKGWKIIYYPKVHITHIKKATKKKVKDLKSVLATVNAMELFYRKRMWKQHSVLVTGLVLLGIRLVKIIRTLKYLIFKT